MSTATTNPATKKQLRVRVDPIRCTAFGFCAEFCPELFDLDEWGYAWLKGRDVDGSLAALIYETAALCPRRAILVEEAEAPRRPRQGQAQATGSGRPARRGKGNG